MIDVSVQHFLLSRHYEKVCSGLSRSVCNVRVFLYVMYVFPTIPVESSLLRSVLLSQLDVIGKIGGNMKVALTPHENCVCRSDWYLSNNSC